MRQRYCAWYFSTDLSCLRLKCAYYFSNSHSKKILNNRPSPARGRGSGVGVVMCDRIPPKSIDLGRLNEIFIV